MVRKLPAFMTEILLNTGKRRKMKQTNKQTVKICLSIFQLSPYVICKYFLVDIPLTG
jgi:hypothetical protein